MMSKTLSINLLKGELRRKVWLYIITTIVMLLIHPVRLLIGIDTLEIYYDTLTIPEKINNIIQFVSFGSGYGMIALIAFSIGYAFVCYRYLYSRSQVDFYHSIPIEKKTMYGVFASTAIVPFFLIDTLIFIANLAILSANNMLVKYSFITALSTYIYTIVVFVFLFSIATIAIMITGQFLTGILGTIALLTAPSLFDDLFILYRSYCYQTNYNSADFSWIGFVLEPIVSVSSLKPQVTNGIAMFIVFIVEAVLLFLLGLFLFVKRPSEGAHKSVCYRGLYPFIRIPFVVGVALSGGIYVAFLAASLGAVWFWISLVISGIIAHALVNGIIYADIKKAMKDIIQLAVALVVAIGIAIFFIYDISGYDRYIPKEDDIEYASISFQGIHDDMSNYLIKEDAAGYSVEYIDTTSYRLGKMKTSDIASVRELALLGVDKLNPVKSAIERNTIITTGYTSSDDYTAINYYVIKFHLKSGKDVYRMYSANMDDTYDLTEKIYNTSEYKDSILQLKDFAEYNLINKITGYDRNNNTAFELTDEQAENLVMAIDADYRATTLDTMADEYPVVGLQSYSGKSFYNDCMYGYYIYPSFSNSLDLLKSYGIEINTETQKLDSDKIQSVTASRYSYETEESMEATYEAGVDDAIIKEISDVAIMENFTYVNSILRNYEMNIDISCNYVDDNGYLVSYYIRIPKGTLPEKVKSDLGM